MKKFYVLSIFALMFVLFTAESCDDRQPKNMTAINEQAHTELNQSKLLKNQPLPSIDWSMERDNLIKLKRLQNDRNINFYMYIFNEGIQQPIGYYQVNKVSSVNSQLSSPEQVLTGREVDGLAIGEGVVVSSPSEDGSYGTNGDAVFGFTPEGICIQSNMHYICSTVPLNFAVPVTRLAIINTELAQKALDASLEAMKEKK